MLLLVEDENFNNDILRGLLRRNSSLDIVRIQDVGLTHAPDLDVLERAALENRVLLTHDRNTILISQDCSVFALILRPFQSGFCFIHEGVDVVAM